MKSTPTPRARFIAVIALIVVAGGGLLVFLNTQGTKSAKPHLIRTQTSTEPRTQTSKTTSTTATTNTTTTTAKPRSKPKPAPTSVATALDGALLNHAVVVVSLYSPEVSTDTAAMSEARAGAAAANAGFVAFNIYDEKLARQLASLLGADFDITNPEVLFFKRPRTLAFELQGFVDSQVVAQAASDLHPAIEFWASEAGGICKHYGTSLGTLEAKVRNSDLTATAGQTEAAVAMDQAAALFNKEAQALGAIKASAAEAKSFAEVVAGYRQAATNMSSEAQALRRNDLTAARAIETRNAVLAISINSLVAKLNLSGCSA
jgi:hypothetical protein